MKNYKEHKYFLGKVDGHGNGRKDCACYITWNLENKLVDGVEKPVFSMCAETWNSRKTDVLECGQCVDRVAGYFPHNKKAQRMVEIWQTYHLNNMQAACEHQRAAGWGKKREVLVTSWSIFSYIYERTQKLHHVSDPEEGAQLGREIAEANKAGAEALGTATFYKRGEHMWTPEQAEAMRKYATMYKSELKDVHQVRPEEHPEGILCKPCPICGYEWGREWRYMPIPENILEEIRSWSAEVKEEADDQDHTGS